MKKYLSLSMVSLIGFAFLFQQCKKEDTGTTPSVDPAAAKAEFGKHLSDRANTLMDPKLKANSAQPASDSPAKSGAYELPTGVLNKYSDHGYEKVSYRGAVDPSATELWYAKDDWSLYSHLVRDVSDKDRGLPTGNTVKVTSEWLKAEMDKTDKTYTFEASKYYQLDGFVVVHDGYTLTIEAGTIIGGKGQPSSGISDATSALIVARGGKLMAEGTSMKPIIFTYDGDMLDGTKSAADTKEKSGAWGGVIILGKARLNSANNETAIEGIPTGNTWALYGGNSDNDHSGSLKYVSIRHGGHDIGAGNEINGLTLGGVGSKTTLEHIEIIANKDDGIEFFGGTAGVRHLIVGYCKDDAFDLDEGYRGFNQFVILHLNDEDGASDRGLEADGGTKPEDGEPYAVPLLTHITVIGGSSASAAHSRLMIVRDNAGGKYYNGIFTTFKGGIQIEYLGDAEQDSWKQFKAGRIEFHSNIFYEVGSAQALAEVFALDVK